MTNTEETSHTRSESRSRTDGVSVGDEITFELVYDHQVQPETLMALPEDQMLAPNIVGARRRARPRRVHPSAVDQVARDARLAVAESRMVALVIDPSVVGADSVAPVAPHEIPAYEPPAPRSPRTSPTTSASRAQPSGAGRPANFR